MNVQQSLVLGVIQGLTEFIPVSSTAHLILAPQVLSIPAPRPEIAHTYDTFIQIGTVIPVLIYFWHEWLKLLKAGVQIVKQGRFGEELDQRMLKYLLLGSLPAGIVGLLLEKRIERFANPAEFPPAFLIIGTSLILVGIVMWWAELTGRKTRVIGDVRTADAWVVGCAQALALIPGVSRSGSTITAGLFSGLSREAAARFSFLLMTPIMLAATGYKLLKLLKGGEVMTGDEWQGMLLATVVAAITGYLAIAFLLNWLKNRSLGIFAIYRILVGAFSIGLFFMQQPGGAHRAAKLPVPEVGSRISHAAPHAPATSRVR